jgi:hypothetical protein
MVGWMPREGMNKREDSDRLRRLTGTLSPRFSAGYTFPLSNLLAAPPGLKRKAPAKAGTNARANHSIAADWQAHLTGDGRAPQ